MTNAKLIRPTVAGLVIRFAEDGTPLMAYSRSSKSGINEFTTVGGGIESKESDVDAMKRELLEEYGYPSCEALQIIDLRYQATRTRRGITKNYRWFLVIDHHRGDVTKINPDSDEVVEIRWDSLHLFSQFSACFSEEKRTMLEEAIRLVHQNYGQLLQKRRRVA